MKFVLITRDGDKWEYDDLEEARMAQYIFGGKIARKDGE